MGTICRHTLTSCAGRAVCRSHPNSLRAREARAGNAVREGFVCVEAGVAVAGAHHLKTSPRTKITVEQVPQDALRCGLSGVASFVRSDVAKVVYANCPRRHLQVTAGTIYLPQGYVDVLSHDEV